MSIFDLAASNPNPINRDLRDPGEFSWTHGDGDQIALTSIIDRAVVSFASPRKPRKVDPRLPDEQLYLDPVPVGKVIYPVDDSDRAYLESVVVGKKLLYQPLLTHDHPISHLLTEWNEESVLTRIGQRNVIDVAGNPRRHIRNGRFNVYSYVSEVTAKDAVRNFSGLPRTTVVPDFSTPNVKKMLRNNPLADTFLMTHSQYYFSVDQIGLMAHHRDENPGSSPVRIYSIVHRHPKMAGFLNNGELEYQYVSDTRVHQWSVKTGEGYEHDSLEPWFHAGEAQTHHGPIAWTTTQLMGDTYLLEIVPYKKAKHSKPLPRLSMKESIVTVRDVGNYRVKEAFGLKWVEYRGAKEVKKLTDVELFDHLRRHIAFRPRDSTEHKNLTLLARRLVDKKDIFAKYLGPHSIPPEDLVWYVEAAFYADLQQEIDLMISNRKKFGHKVDLHTKLLENPAHHEDSQLSQLLEAAGSTVGLGQDIVNKASGVASRFVPSFGSLKTGAEFAVDAGISAATYTSHSVGSMAGLNVQPVEPVIRTGLVRNMAETSLHRVQEAVETIIPSYVKPMNTFDEPLIHELVEATTKSSRMPPRSAPPMYAPPLPKRPGKG